MRLFLIGVLLFLQPASLQPSPGPAVPSHEPQEVSQAKQDHTQGDKTPANEISTISKSDTVANEKRTETSSTKKSEKSTQDQLITWFTGVLAAVAVLQLGILALQFWAAHRQAEYLKRAERAHVDLEFVGDKHIYTIMFANYGKSVATVVEYRFMHSSYPLEMDEFTAESASASFEDTIPMKYILPPGTAPREYTSFDLRTFLPQQALEGIHQVIVRGLIVYEDIFGDEHETEVAYRYRSFDLKLKNLPEYNRYT